MLSGLSTGKNFSGQKFSGISGYISGHTMET